MLENVLKRITTKRLLKIEETLFLIKSLLAFSACSIPILAGPSSNPNAGSKGVAKKICYNNTIAIGEDSASVRINHSVPINASAQRVMGAFIVMGFIFLIVRFVLFLKNRKEQSFQEEGVDEHGAQDDESESIPLNAMNASGGAGDEDQRYREELAVGLELRAKAIKSLCFSVISLAMTLAFFLPYVFLAMDDYLECYRGEALNGWSYQTSEFYVVLRGAGFFGASLFSFDSALHMVAAGQRVIKKPAL